MPEYDAFGREIGEDTLGSWRQGSGTPPPEPAPAPAPAAVSAGDPLGGPAAPPAASPRQTGPPRVAFRPRRRRRGAPIVVLLVLLAVGFSVVSNVAREVEDAARDITIPSLKPPQAAERPPTGLAAGSLLRPGEFRRALAEIRRRGGGKLQHLRVAPERIDATLITRRGTLVNVQVSATEGYRKLSESGPGFSASDTIPFGRLNARVPEKLTRAAAERLGSSPGRINYLVPSLSGGELGWGAYFKTGAIFLADARGRIVRRIS